MKQSKILLIVDLEQTYLTDESYLGLLRKEAWSKAKTELLALYDKISCSVESYKNAGYEIHFTGEGSPYYKINSLVDKIVPYWSNNKELFRDLYSDKDDIVLAGVFTERCIFAVHKLIKGSSIDFSMTISHYVVGDDMWECHCYPGIQYDGQRTLSGFKRDTSREISLEDLLKRHGNVV